METVLTSSRLISADEMAAMMDLGPCELVDGELIVMSPTGDDHGAYELNVGVELRGWSSAFGKVRVGEVGIYIRRSPDTVRAADVIYISNERYAKKTSSAYLEIPPDLVVEIMSPSDSFAGMQQKLNDYFSINVRLVWLLVPELRAVYAYTSPTDLHIFNEHEELTGGDVLPGFSVPVARLFEL